MTSGGSIWTHRRPVNSNSGSLLTYIIPHALKVPMMDSLFFLILRIKWFFIFSLLSLYAYRTHCTCFNQNQSVLSLLFMTFFSSSYRQILLLHAFMPPGVHHHTSEFNQLISHFVFGCIFSFSWSGSCAYKRLFWELSCVTVV